MLRACLVTKFSCKSDFVFILSFSEINVHKKAVDIFLSDSIIRLVDGDGVLSGRVEIYHHDAWGVVCDEDWDFKEAAAVCRQLGFREALEAKTGSFFGESELPMVMSRVACKGTEDRLADCPFVCTSPHQCNRSQEAGVICKPSEISIFRFPQ